MSASMPSGAAEARAFGNGRATTRAAATATTARRAAEYLPAPNPNRRTRRPGRTCLPDTALRRRAGRCSGGERAAPAQADPASRAEHEMVDDVDAQEPPGVRCLPGGADVVGRRRGIAARVVVRQEDGGRVPAHGVLEQLRDADGRARDAASIERSDRDQTLLSVEQRDDELLTIEMREVRRERRGGEFRRVAALPVRAGDDHAPPQLARRGEAHRGRGTEAARAQTRDIGLAKCPQNAEEPEHPVRKYGGGPTPGAAGYQKRDQLA